MNVIRIKDSYFILKNSKLYAKGKGRLTCSNSFSADINTNSYIYIFDDVKQISFFESNLVLFGNSDSSEIIFVEDLPEKISETKIITLTVICILIFFGIKKVTY